MDTRKSHRKNRPLYKRKGFWWSLLIPVVIIGGILGYYWYKFNYFVSAIQGNSATTSTVTWSGTDRVNIMLFGVDNRGGDPNPRTDVNILVSIDPKTRTAEMFSILRDTWYKIPGYSSQKINAAYSLGGPDLAVKTFSDFLQIPINYYAVTDFQGFEKVIDAVGGIDLDVEKNMDYVDDGVYDIHLKKGYQHLNGKQALEYVRFRHDAMGDFWRTERQRKFLKALADQLKKPTSILKLPSVLDAIQPYLKTNMTTEDILKLGQLAKDIDWTNMKSQQLPDMKNLQTGVIDGEDSVIPDVYATRVLVHKMLGMDDTIVKDPSVEYDGPVNSPQTGTNISQTAPAAQSPEATDKTKATEPASQTNSTGQTTTTNSSNPFGETTGKNSATDGTNSEGANKSNGGASNGSAGDQGTGAGSTGSSSTGTGGNSTNTTGTGSSGSTTQGGSGETGTTKPGTGTDTSGSATQIQGSTGTKQSGITQTGVTGTGNTTGTSTTGTSSK